MRQARQKEGVGIRREFSVRLVEVHLVGGAAREIAGAVENQPRNSEFGGGVSCPGQEHVGDETVGVQLLKDCLDGVLQQLHGLEELGGQIGGAHLIEAGDVGGQGRAFWREIGEDEEDVVAGVLGFGDGMSEGRGGDDGCFDTS